MKLHVDGAPHPGFVILLVLTAAGAWFHLRSRPVVVAGTDWIADAPVAHTASAPVLSWKALDPSGRAKTLVFTVQETQRVGVGVYDTAGRLVHSVAASTFPPGTFELPWDGREDATGRHAPPGLYVVRYDFAGAWSARRLLVLGEAR